MKRSQVCLETIKAFNKACRPLVGRNVIVIKSHTMCVDILTGEYLPIELACKRAVCTARKMHRQFYEDNSLRKKWKDAMFHYWSFVNYDEDAEETVRTVNLRPLYQHKQSGRGLFIPNLAHARSSHAKRTTN